ncbi:HlyD family efflux transporter periplasmic adaptor subunit [Clostridiisalibacter paucivorans]|uniref:HlyD family efflux transporter periplasmic adaptor subunit n=1 Tax=Clostridiisalibacter paucivorans TaxID=408753 RepID=UPI00047B3DB6|nr:HlyD family efflux transporter periplasmic adaptor subunit [Clostridiisalibacter paucivorans]
MKKFKKKHLIITGIVIIVIAAIFMTVKMKGQSGNDVMGDMQMPPMETETTVQRGNIESSITGSGNIESRFVKELKAKNDGTVGITYVNEGEEVSKGDVVLELNNDVDNIGINQSNLSIYEEEMNLREMREKAEHLNFKVPFSGVVSDIFVEESDEVSEGEKFLKIIDKDNIEVVGGFNKSLIDNISVGNKAYVLIEGSYESIEGKITKISQEGYGTEDGGLLYDVTVEIKNPGALAEDMDARVIVNGITSPERSKLEWKTNKEVTFEIGGTIEDILIEKNQRVEKGQVICKIKNEDYMRDIDIQEKKLENRKLELDKKKKEINENIIYAPIDGTLVELAKVPGENITSEEVLGKIANLNNLEVTIEVDELDILKVKKGQDAKITVEALEGRELSGKVTKISEMGTVSNGTASFKVTVAIEEAANLKIGMSANIKILLAAKEDTLIVPIEYVINRDNKHYVIVKDEKEGSKELEVEVGLVSKSLAEIISKDIKEGDIIYKEGFAPQKETEANE